MMPIRLTHADVARAFVEQYRPNFKVIRTVRNTIEVWVREKDGYDFAEDVKRYHLRRILRLWLNWVFEHWSEPKPTKLLSTNFLNCVLCEAVSLLYDPERL